MEALNGGRIWLDRTAELGGWRILMAHSNIPGHVEGELDERQIQWLDECLSATHRPGLLALHHPPLAVGSAWMDRIGLRNGERLAELVRRHASLKCIIHGHAHQAGCVYTDGRPCYGTPSTWRQFVPATAEHRMDSLPPALRVIRLAPDGSHSSWVEFVQTPS
jgi:Icc protein